MVIVSASLRTRISRHQRSNRIRNAPESATCRGMARTSSRLRLCNTLDQSRHYRNGCAIRREMSVPAPKSELFDQAGRLPEPGMTVSTASKSPLWTFPLQWRACGPARRELHLQLRASCRNRDSSFCISVSILALVAQWLRYRHSSVTL